MNDFYRFMTSLLNNATLVHYTCFKLSQLWQYAVFFYAEDCI